MIDAPAIPHSREAEEALLGSLMIAPELLPEIVLRPKDFYIVRHQWIFQAMRDLEEKKQAIDIVTLSELLEHRGQLKELGGGAYLTTLTMQSPNSYNAIHYADIVLDKANRRRDLGVANMIVEGAYNGGVDRARMVDMLTQNADNRRGAVRLSTGLKEFGDMVAERSKDPRDVWGFPTGIVDLDNRVHGLQKQQTTMFVGSPGVGKTTIMLQIALNLAKDNHPGVIYELEMDMQPRLIARLMMMLTNVPVSAMMSGRMDDHWPAFTHGIEQLEAMNLYVSDNPVMDTMRVRADAARMKAQHGIEWIALDYLNLLTDKDGDSGNDNTANKATRFRQICREFDLAGITVQSVNKEGMKAIVPHLADMSGPAEVAFSADKVFFLVQDPEIEQDFKLLPAKQRDGDKGNKPIPLMKPKGKLTFECVARY